MHEPFYMADIHTSCTVVQRQDRKFEWVEECWYSLWNGCICNLIPESYYWSLCDKLWPH